MIRIVLLGDNEESKRMVETWNDEEVYFRNTLDFSRYSVFCDKSFISVEEQIFTKKYYIFLTFSLV